MQTTRDTTRRLKYWFLASGCLGVLVAVGLAVFAASHEVKPMVILVLWPSSIVGIVDPSSPPDKALVGLLEFGGNFILYGGIGMLAGLCLP